MSITPMSRAERMLRKVVVEQTIDLAEARERSSGYEADYVRVVEENRTLRAEKAKALAAERETDAKATRLEGVVSQQSGTIEHIRSGRTAAQRKCDELQAELDKARGRIKYLERRLPDEGGAS